MTDSTKWYYVNYINGAEVNPEKKIFCEFEKCGLTEKDVLWNIHPFLHLGGQKIVPDVTEADYKEIVKCLWKMTGIHPQHFKSIQGFVAYVFFYKYCGKFPEPNEFKRSVFLSVPDDEQQTMINRAYYTFDNYYREVAIESGANCIKVDMNSNLPCAMEKLCAPTGAMTTLRTKEECDDVLKRVTSKAIYTPMIVECDIQLPAEKLDVNVIPNEYYEEGKSRVWKYTENIRKGCYTTIDLALAKSFGYKITKVHRAIKWDGKPRYIFSDYVLDMYKFKEKGGRIEKAYAKVLLNMLYGLMSQKDAVARKEIIIRSADGKEVKQKYDELMRKYDDVFITRNSATDEWILQYDKKLARTFQAPRYLGAFIVAKSRRKIFDRLKWFGVFQGINTHLYHYKLDCLTFINDGNYKINNGKGLGEYKYEFEKIDKLCVVNGNNYYIETKDGEICSKGRCHATSYGEFLEFHKIEYIPTKNLFIA